MEDSTTSVVDRVVLETGSLCRTIGWVKKKKKSTNQFINKGVEVPVFLWFRIVT